jgi:hypothetical protein
MLLVNFNTLSKHPSARMRTSHSRFRLLVRFQGGAEITEDMKSWLTLVSANFQPRPEALSTMANFFLLHFVFDVETQFDVSLFEVSLRNQIKESQLAPYPYEILMTKEY